MDVLVSMAWGCIYDGRTEAFGSPIHVQVF